MEEIEPMIDDFFLKTEYSFMTMITNLCKKHISLIIRAFLFMLNVILMFIFRILNRIIIKPLSHIISIILIYCYYQIAKDVITVQHLKKMDDLVHQGIILALGSNVSHPSTSLVTGPM
ncbi:13.6 kDa protein [Psammotettix alienus reovirus]|nr:13.6 kDa protein [Psammotettix alienus reovirus]